MAATQGGWVSRPGLRVWVVGAVTALALLPACSTTPARTTTSRVVHIRSVDWTDVVVPGSVCDSSGPIRLEGGQATIVAPPELHADTPRVVAMEDPVRSNSNPVYGNVNGAGQDEAALDVWCDSTSGTAEGQLADSWVIYSADSGSLRVLGTVVPETPPLSGHHVPFFATGPGAIVLQPGKITVQEVSYGPNDATCCPSGRTTSVWIYADGVLRGTVPTRSNPRG